MVMADSENGGSPVDFAERAAMRSGVDTAACRSPECLDYIADMILEMRRLAARSGHLTLAERLDAAHREAETLRGRR